jgi:hypothetical protein
MVVPEALRVLRLKPGRKYCTVKVGGIFIGGGEHFWDELKELTYTDSVCLTKLDGDTRMLSTALRKRGRSNRKHSTNARYLLISSISCASHFL